MKITKIRTYGRPIALNLIFMAIAAGIMMLNLTHRHSQTTAPVEHQMATMFTTDPAEKYIIDKAVSIPVSAELFPVAIYEVHDNMQYFGASGVCYFKADTGTWRLITMAHVFFKRDRPTSFILRKLTPCEAAPSWCIERIVKIGAQWGANIDLAECDIKPLVMPLPIVPCTFEVNLDRPTFTDAYTFEEVRPTGLTNVSTRVVTSLLSRERVTLCGIVPEADHQSWYYLANYTFIKGESGTGFIDEHGSLYFAEGSSASEVTPAMTKKFNLAVKIPGLVLGPFDVRVK